MLTFFRNRMFLEGIALGGICGVIIGSIIAFSLGESSVEALRRAINKRIPGPNANERHQQQAHGNNE